MFSALEKQGTVLPPWGRSVASLSWANKCPVVCVIAARLKGKKQSKPTLYVEGRPKGSLNPLRKGHSSAERLGSISVGQPQSLPSALSADDQATSTGGEPRAGALLRQNSGELREHELLHCTVLCHKAQSLAPRIWECHHRPLEAMDPKHPKAPLLSSVPWAVCSHLREPELASARGRKHTLNNTEYVYDKVRRGDVIDPFMIQGRTFYHLHRLSLAFMLADFPPERMKQYSSE